MRFGGWWIAGGLWVCAVAGGFAVLLSFKSTAGMAAVAPATWPTDTKLAISGDRATLLLFVHPHCVCSRASLTEFNHLVARVRDRVTPMVVMVRPKGTPDGWEQTGLRAFAATIPGVRVVDDLESAEARRFGAATSGTTLLYDRSGHLLFDGGITALRGHEGTSFGQERIVALLTTGASDRSTSPVFGCELDDPAPPPADIAKREVP